MIKGYMEVRETDILVGARETASNYEGPAARVSHSKDWLCVVTDDHEGSAMLNIEALPYLRRALAWIAKEIKGAKK